MKVSLEKAAMCGLGIQASMSVALKATVVSIRSEKDKIDLCTS